MWKEGTGAIYLQALGDLQEENSERAGAKAGGHNGHPSCSEPCLLGTTEASRFPHPSSTQHLTVAMGPVRFS